MTERPGARGLDAETLAAYVDGRLHPEERASVEREIAADPELGEWLAQTLTALDALAEHPPSGAPVERQPALQAAATTGAGAAPGRGYGRVIAGATLATAAAAALVALLAPPGWRPWRSPPRPMSDLAAVASTERYLEGRLSGGFAHVAARPVVRGRELAANRNLALLALAGELSRQASADPTPERLQVWGAAQLMAGDLPAGIATLRRSHALRPTAAVASDLAAGLIELAAASGDAGPLREALVLLTPVVASPSPPVEALFNHALALDALAAPEADVAWQRVVAADPDPRWRAEAAERLRRRQDTR